MLKRVVDFTLINPIMKWFVKRCCFCSFWGHLLRFCFAIFHSIVPSADIQRSGLLESRALKFGMFLWGVPAGPRGPAGCLDWWETFLEKAQVTVLLPGNCSFSEWTDMVDCMPHSWPKSFNIGRMQMGPLRAASFHKHRKFTRARHMWLFLNPDWRLLSSHMYTEWPGIHSYAEINDRLFVNPGRNDNIQDTLSKVKYASPVYWQWVQQWEYMGQFVDGQVSPVQIKMEDTLAEYRDNLCKEKAEIALHMPRGKKRWKTKEGTYQLKHPEDGEQTEQTMPTADEATFAEMLRDV